MQPYSPRPIAERPPVHHGDWTLKRYSICYGDASFDPSRFADGVQLAVEALPSPAITPGRLGVGFIIEHQGNGVDYLVLAWWDRENELPLRVFVRDREPDSRWRPARGSESVCVWDLEVIWMERQAYVGTVMSEPKSPREEYLCTIAATHREQGERPCDAVPS